MNLFKVTGFVGGGLATVIIITVLYRVYKRLSDEKQSGTSSNAMPDVKELDELTIEEIEKWFQENEKGKPNSHMLLYSTEGQINANMDPGFQEVLKQLKKEAGLFKNSSDFIAQVIYDKDKVKVEKYRLVFFKTLQNDLNQIFEDADFFRKQIIEIES